jgi:hypothetical protein
MTQKTSPSKTKESWLDRLGALIHSIVAELPYDEGKVAARMLVSLY